MKVIVKNIVTEYSDHGEGDVILMLHGWQSEGSSFNEITSILSQKYRVVTLDLPGFGKTDTPSKPWSVKDYAVFTSLFIEKTNISPKALIGHSFGGRIIIKGISHGFFTSEKIILISSAGVTSKNKNKIYILKIAAKIAKTILVIPPLSFFGERIKKRTYKILQSDYYSSGVMRETMSIVVAEDLSEYAKKIKLPTLLIWGEKDNQTPVNDGKKLAQLIDSSKLVVINDKGHFVHKEEPLQVASIIKEFLC